MQTLGLGFTWEQLSPGQLPLPVKDRQQPPQASKNQSFQQPWPPLPDNRRREFARMWLLIGS